jgi:ferrous iron transport protein A
MTLDQLSLGERARVITVRGGRRLQINLEQMGIHAGDTVVVAGSGAFRGPFLIEVRGIRLALGRGVARRILVEPLTRPA